MSKQWIDAYFTTSRGIRYSDMEYVQSFVKKALEMQEEGSWKNIIIDIENDEDLGQFIVLRGKRLETDTEYEQRTKHEQYQKQVRRKMYEDLKKEFGE